MNLDDVENEITVYEGNEIDPAPSGLISLAYSLADECRRLTAELAEAKAWKSGGELLMDMIQSHCSPDELPSEDEADFYINGWLRMRAERDEAKAELAAATAKERERCEKIARKHELIYDEKAVQSQEVCCEPAVTSRWNARREAASQIADAIAKGD